MINVVDGSTETWYFYHYDGLGSVVALSKYDSTLGSAVIVERYQYSPFGITTIYNADKTQEFDESQYGNPYMFTGRRFDPETGLYYYRMRYYSPDLGRFLQPDPIGYADGMNIYAYVHNNPLNFIDPWGLDSYLASRPLGGDSKYFSHNYIAVNADYIGDPDATIYSYGKNAKSKVGRVDINTTGFSKGTHQTDIKHWNSLGPKSRYVSSIPASDAKVEATANSLIENQRYSAVSGPFGANSNSAAQAVANESAGKNVPTPDGKRVSPGAGSWDEIEFDKKGS